jgi:hypothetical protein
VFVLLRSFGSYIYYLFYYLVCEAIGTAATPGLLCQPRVIMMMMIVEKQIECRLAGETEILGENLPQRHFRPSQNPTRPDPGLNPGRRGGKPATNRLSFGAAISSHMLRKDEETHILGDETLVYFNKSCRSLGLYHVRCKFVLAFM